MELIPAIQAPGRKGAKEWNILKSIWTGAKNLEIDSYSLSLPPVSDKILLSAFYCMKYHRNESIAKALGFSTTKIYMDSGGYQVLTKGVSMDPTELIRYQETNADVAFTIDVPLPKGLPVADISDNVRRTIQYAVTMVDARMNPSLKLYAVVHALSYDDARKVTSQYEKHPFDGYAVGSLVPRKNKYELMAEVIAGVRSATDRPTHVFGISGFNSIYLLARLRVDSYDSQTFVQASRFREYIVPQLAKRVSVGRGGGKTRKISSTLPCSCPICQIANQEGGATFFSKEGSHCDALLAIHNLIAMKEENTLINAALTEGWLEQLIKDRTRDSKSMQEAWRSIEKRLIRNV